MREGCRLSTADPWWLGTGLQDGLTIRGELTENILNLGRRAFWEVKELQRATIGRGPDSGMKECQYLSPSLRNPTPTHRLVGARGFSKLSGKREEGGYSLGELQAPLTCIQSQPTHRGLEKHSVHTQLFGNNFHTGKNSEAGSQSSAGKGSSLEFIRLWKGLLGYLMRPLLPESLKEHSWKEGP